MRNGLGWRGDKVLQLLSATTLPPIQQLPILPELNFDQNNFRLIFVADPTASDLAKLTVAPVLNGGANENDQLGS